MPLIIVRNDITRMKVDAIVNAANNTLLGGGGVDGAIHKAAGERLLKKCRTLGGCETGQAKITKGYNLPAKYIIHTVGPVWQGGDANETNLLYGCYLNSLSLAKKHGCGTVAFPLISSGAYGFPKRLALDIATNAIRHFLESCEITVYIVVYDKESFGVGTELFPNIRQYIDDRSVIEPTMRLRRDVPLAEYAASLPIDSCIPECASSPDTVCDTKSISDADNDGNADVFSSYAPMCMPMQTSLSSASEKRSGKLHKEKKLAKNETLEEKLKRLDESFSEMLLRKIDESGMSDSECYKKANIDRKLFSKIRSDKHYKPSKPTVLAFAIALHMNIDDTKDFLARAGFAFSPASKFDVIIEYFITNGNYDIFEINNALFAFDQSLLGA